MHIATFSEEVIRQSFEVFDKQINLMFDGPLKKGTFFTIAADKSHSPVTSFT
jgi:hypothetical protein